MKHFFLFLAFGAALASAAPVDIKLGTILPAGTSGHKRLLELRDRWRQTSADGVRLTVQAGTGDTEIQLIKKLRADTLQAVLVSAVGLAQIDRSVTCLQLMPLAFRNWQEVDYVRGQIAADLEARLREKGFEVLFWADAGWVRFFSKQPAVEPGDFKPRKMFVWSGDPQQLTIMRSLGYHPVGLETEHILSSLSTGMIDAVPVPPFLANALQYFKYAGHMVDLEWVPIVGAAIISRKTWETIPPDQRAELRHTAVAIGEQLRLQHREDDTGSITAMKKRGLVVHAVSPEHLAAWRVTAEKVWPQIRGAMVPEELFDRVLGHLAEFRASRVSTAP